MSQAAGEVKLILAADGATWSDALDKAKSQLKQLEGAAGSAATTTKNQMREAQGSIALLGEEIGVTLPRHVRSFVAKLPGVATAMSEAFNAVAIIAIGMAIYEAGHKAYEFFEKGREAAEKQAEAWRTLETPLRDTNDELRVANDRLDNSIAKLEHKPQNGLKQAIDEAILSADKLGEKLTEDSRNIVEVLKGEQSGILDWITGSAGTQDITGRAKKLREDLDEIDSEGHRRLEELRRQNATQDKVDAATRDLNTKRKARIDQEIQWTDTQIDTSKKAQATIDAAGKDLPAPGASSVSGYAADDISGGLPDDQRKRIAALMRYKSPLASASDLVALSQTNSEKTGKQSNAQANSDNESAAKQAAAKQMQAWRQQLNAVKAQTDVSADMEANYWQALAESVRKNAPLFLLAQDEANKAGATSNKEFEAGLGRMVADGIRDKQAAAALAEQQNDELKRTSLDADRAWKQSDRQAFAETVAGIDEREQLAEARIREQFDTGHLSRLAAAMATQAVHQKAAGDFQSALEDAQAQGVDVPGSMIDQRNKRSGIQSQTDADAVRMSTVTGALVSSLDQLEQAFTDSASMVRDVFMQSLGEFNDTLVKMLSEPSWQRGGSLDQLGSSVFSSVSKSALQAGEGQLLKAIGFGKKSDGYHVWVDNLGAGSSTSSSTSKSGIGGWISTILGLFTHGAGGAAGGGAGVADGAAGGLPDLGSVPFYANGGPLASGMPAIVGDAGPELFVPSTSGRVIPNRDLAGMGGTTIHVDARGSQDPAAVEASVHRALASYIPAMQSAAVAAVRDDRRRAPQSWR